MEHYHDLDEHERQQLLKFPAYISLLATSESHIDRQEKKIASKLTHIKTFSSEPPLLDFYQEVEKNFDATITELDKELPEDKEGRRLAIMRELKKLEAILAKLGPKYALALHKSLRSYTSHVSKAHHHVFEDFVFPIHIKGLTDL